MAFLVRIDREKRLSRKTNHTLAMQPEYIAQPHGLHRWRRKPRPALRNERMFPACGRKARPSSDRCNR